MFQLLKKNIVGTHITVTDYTLFDNEKICLAGVNNAGKTCRLLPYLTHEEYHQQGIYLASRLYIFGKFIQGENPHIEDFCLREPIRVTHTQNIPAFRKALERTCVHDISIYFGEIGSDKSLPDAADAICSLVTVRVEPKNIEAVSHIYRNKLRLNFSLADGTALERVSLRQFNHMSGLADDNVQARIALINARIQQSKVIYLRLGVTRLTNDMHWLQANGIYFFDEEEE